VEPQNPIDVLWERLATSEPSEVAAKAAVVWKPDEEAYTVPFLGTPLHVHPGARRVDGPDGSPGHGTTLVCVQYLLSARDDPPLGTWVSPLQLPHGDFFFRGPHAPPRGRIERAFGQAVEQFEAAAAGLGGVAHDLADAAFEFRALPRLSVIIALWAADEEFPARARFLLDPTASRQLPLDALWLVLGLLARRLADAGS
jgi:hypothetical protein